MFNGQHDDEVLTTAGLCNNSLVALQATQLPNLEQDTLTTRTFETRIRYPYAIAARSSVISSKLAARMITHEGRLNCDFRRGGGTLNLTRHTSGFEDRHSGLHCRDAYPGVSKVLPGDREYYLR